MVLTAVATMKLDRFRVKTKPANNSHKPAPNSTYRSRPSPGITEAIINARGMYLRKELGRGMYYLGNFRLEVTRCYATGKDLVPAIAVPV
jgi:hypothetical protein